MADHIDVYYDSSQKSISEALAKTTQEMCEPFDVSPNDGVPCMLIAAFYIVMLITGQSAVSLLPLMQECLVSSARAADGYSGNRKLDS